jgi:hypothetical protein
MRHLVFDTGAWPVSELAITSVGPPPALHADRVVGQMAGHLIEQAAHIRGELQQIIAHSNDGGPRAQRKLREKLLQAGTVMGRRIVACNLVTAKKGRYSARLCFWSGWDRDRDCEIEPGDRIPPRPQVCLWYVEIQGLSHHRVEWHRAPLCFLSHHILSRMAQRHEMRTLDDMLTAIARIAIGIMNLYMDKGVDQKPIIRRARRNGR